MTKSNHKLFSFLIIIFVLTQNLSAQNKKGEMQEIKELFTQSNNIHTILYNYGSVSAPGALTDVKDFVWNGLGYMYEFGTLIGAEVVNSNEDTLHIVSDSFVSSRDGDYNSEHNIKWGWLPEPGFSNSNSDKIANRKDKSSWSELWNDWPNEYGTQDTIGLNEAYYKMNDFTNAEFNYYPFVSDTTKRGLGVSATVRVYQFGGGMKDALILKYFIKNESDKDLNKVYFGFFGDPHIGGVGDANDDRVHIFNSSSFNKLVKNTIYLWDDDFSGRAGKRPGYLSFKFLETPDSNGLTSFNVMQWSDYHNVPKNDSLMWSNFTGGKDTSNYLYNNKGDNVIDFGTGPFSLLKGETKVIKLAIFLSHNFDDIINDAKYISLHHNWDTVNNKFGESAGNPNYKVQLKSIPNSINGNNEITWNYSGSNPDAKIFLEYSYNKGKDWIPLAFDLNASDSFIWNTNQVKDGVNYMLRIVAYDKNNPKDYYYNNSAGRFTINNPNKNAQPELDMNLALADSTISSSPLKIKWISEDADNRKLQIKLEYSYHKYGSYNQIINKEFTNGENSYNWDIKNLPNTKKCFVKITASDGNKDTVLISDSFSINIFKTRFSNAHIKTYRGNATPEITIQTIDEAQLTNDEYSILFHVSNNNKTFDIKNITQNKELISGYPVNDSISTPEIDGMKITIKDSGNDIDYNKTRYVGSNSSFKYKIEFPPVMGNPKIKIDDDYLIVFNNMDTLSNGSWAEPQTFNTQIGNVQAPFNFWNIKGNAPDFSYKEQATFVLYEPLESKKNNGQWDKGEYIILQPQGATDTRTSYQIYLDIENGNYPTSGDSLYIITYNQIEDNDEFRFSPDSNFVVDVLDNKISNKFILEQNYPNPFNPETTIQYNIPFSKEVYGMFKNKNNGTNVQLKVYDVLGREVATLVNAFQKPGNYKVQFNATKLSAGVYYYRIKIGNFIRVKKMIYLK